MKKCLLVSVLFILWALILTGCRADDPVAENSCVPSTFAPGQEQTQPGIQDPPPTVSVSDPLTAVRVGQTLREVIDILGGPGVDISSGRIVIYEWYLSNGGKLIINFVPSDTDTNPPELVVSNINYIPPS